MCDSVESYTIGAKYRTVKKRLDSLGYKHSLSLDSLSLVEQLLADLIKTTESLKHFKSVAVNNTENRNPQIRFKDESLDECNRLHEELLQCKESNLKVTKDLKKKIQRLESETADLQLAASRNLKRIKDLEVESANKSKRIQELLGKCCKPTVSNTLGNKKRTVFPLRKPVLEADPLPVDASDNNRYINLSKVDQRSVDLVAMGDRKISSLTHELTKLKNELSQQKDNIVLYREQLALKDKEVYRLKKIVEAKIGNDCTCRKNERCVECNLLGSNKLSEINEVRVLQQAKLNLEQQLRDALDKQHDAMTQAMKLAERNEELEKELKDIDHIALAVEADCNSTVKENNKRVSQLQEKLEKTMAQIRQLETNLLGEKRTSQELRADLESCRAEKRNIQRSLDNLEEENRQLTNRLNDLNIIEPHLNAEINRLERVNQNQRFELAELREENRLLKEQLDNNKSNVKKNSKSIGKIDKRMSHDTSSKVAEKGEKIKQLEKTIHQLERDKNYYREEWNKLLSQRKDADTTELWSQICELKQQLNEKELKIMELQRERKELAREKFELENKLKTCRSVGSCGCFSENGSRNSQLKVLERERDSARTDVNRLTEERDILRERLKLATDAHTSEQRRLRERLRDLELKLEDVEREKHNYILSQESRRSAVTGLEDQLEDVKEELRRTKQELTSQRTQYFQLRALQDQTDQALGDVQSQLHHSEAELTKAVEHSRDMEQQNIQLNNVVKEQKQEINTLRTSMARLDREKDQLLMELDEKTEKIAGLEREVMLKEQQASGIEQQLRDMQRKNQICVDQTAEQERQLRNLQMELENSSRQMAAAANDRDNALMENRRLQDDLAAVTCEFRTLQRELEASKAESHDLKRQLQTYVSEVRRAEELLNRKENERTEMLNHYRSLSLEATVLENNNHSLESEAAEARGALQSARDRLVDLERQLADKDCLIRGYEAQITELTQNVASLETQIRQQLEHRGTAETDLNAVRDLCVQLDQQKEALKKEINDKDAIIAQCEAKLSRFKAENNAVHDQKSRDHVTIDRLQMLLDQARRESINYQKNNQELLNEIDRLKQRIDDLQNKLSSESAELQRCQNQAAEYSNQVAELRRKVTDERFNRARTEEKHRRSYPYSDQMHMSGEPAPTGVSPSSRDFMPQELGTNIRFRDDGYPDTLRDFTATTKESDVVPGESITDSGYIVHHQEERPRTPSRKKSLPCAKNCCTEDTVDGCPASKCDKSVSTDAEKTKRKKTQTDKNFRPRLVDAAVSVPAVADASVSIHELSNSVEEISVILDVPDVPNVPQVPNVPNRHQDNRLANATQRQVPGTSKDKNTDTVPGTSEIPKKRGRPRKDPDDCGCTVEIQLPNCRVQVPPEPPEQDENEEPSDPSDLINRTFDRVHDLTRTVQDKLNSMSFSGEASQPSRGRDSFRRSGTSENENEVVVEESSTSLIIETGTRPRVPPVDRRVPRTGLRSGEVPQVSSEPARPERIPTPPTRVPTSPRRVPSPERVPSAPRRDPSPHRRVPTPPRRVLSPERVPPPHRRVPSEHRRVPTPPRRVLSPERVPPPHRRVPTPPRRVPSPPRRVPTPPEHDPPPPRRVPTPPERVPPPPRLPAQPRPRIPVPFKSQGPPAPPRPPKQKKPPKEKQCDLTRCHKCPMVRPPRQHVQFPRRNLQPIHTSSPVASSHAISRPNHRYHLRSHAKTVYKIENGAAKVISQTREESSSSGSEVARVRRKKSRKLSDYSDV
ncbi:centrosomal protein of 135 kDa isoform X6 [Cotesia glomerata]|uniref:centrosomal protein of 135 kDa isoform X6 n=1 Tax=Cotesia glomerata TaxID=32391 RepID=UPI001D014AB2|nr:centrosomal protein of 135 kDa isoform X6 [Cotesia glomerata]